MHAEPAIQAKTSNTANAARNQPFFQAKLKIGDAKDPAEKEADTIADHVVQRSSAQQPFFTAVAPTIQKKSSEEEEEIQRQTSEEEEQVQAKEKANGVAAPPANFETNLNATRGSGEALSPALRAQMEENMQADFSQVRIHRDGQAAAMSQDIGARAFTVGRDVYFNRGEYAPETPRGKHLLAHELVHTIQQGAIHSDKTTVNRSAQTVQRGLLDRAWGAVRGAVSRVVEWTAERLQEGINWVKEQARNFVSNIPGYFALTVALGQDPITGNQVQRNGMNFILAGISLIPGGDWLKRKLEENGALAEAAAWLDAELLALDLNLGGIVSELSAIWRSLGVSDVSNPQGVLQRVGNIFVSRIERLIRFGVNVGTYFVQIVKRFVIAQLADYVRTRTRVYPLITIILGSDPITEETVDRTPEAILQAVLNLSENGPEIYRQVSESGALARVLAYVSEIYQRGLAILALLKTNIIAAWNLVTVENLMSPLDTFTQILGFIAEPALAMIDLVVFAALEFLKMVKDALIAGLKAFAHNIPGYRLLTVILGRDPFTNEAVERNAINIIRGFFGLIPGGDEQFLQLQETGAIDRMATWITGAIEQLGLIGTSIIEAFLDLWNNFGWSDLARPTETFGRVIEVVRRPISLIVNFVIDVVKQLIIVLMQVMNFPADLLQSLIQNAMTAFNVISRNPINFLKNLLRALKRGFELFFENIITHLINGVSGWLFGQLEEAGIQPPQDFSFRSILGFVLQILGITAQRIWQMVVRKIGPARAAQLERVMNTLSGVWGFVKDVMERGPAAIWERIQDGLSNLWQLVLDGVKDFLMTRVIAFVTRQILSLLDPTGIMAVVNSFMAIFRAIQSFIEQFRRILQLLNSLAEGVIEIASGNIQAAAEFLERAFARAMPIVISFLANQMGLGGLGRRVGEMIERLQQRIENAIEALIDRAIRLGAAVFNAAREGAQSVVQRISNWWQLRKPVRTRDGQNHTLYFDGSGNNSRLMIQSTPQNIIDFLSNIEESHNKTPITNAIATINRLKSVNVTDANREQHSADMNMAIDTLTNLLQSAPLKTNQSNSPILHGPMREGYGTLTRVAFRKTPFTRGTEPTRNVSGSFNDINRRRSVSGDGAYYIKGHLLNDNLGGLGEWLNLSPINVAANSEHHNHFEKAVKIAVNDTEDRGVNTAALSLNGYMKDFTVQATYGRSLPQVYNDLNREDADFPSSWNDDWDVDDMKKLLLAEQHVPTSFVCRATIKDGTPNAQERTIQKTVTNDIKYGQLSVSNYSLGGGAKNPVTLVSFIDKNAPIDRDKTARLRQLNGIGDARAQKILDAFRDNGRITDYLQQTGLTRKRIHQLNPTYKFTSGVW